jgi:hypothetical protein
MSTYRKESPGVGADSAEQTEAEKPAVTFEDRVERIVAYWGRAFVLAWRTVFPPREDFQ